MASGIVDSVVTPVMVVAIELLCDLLCARGYHLNTAISSLVCWHQITQGPHARLMDTLTLSLITFEWTNTKTSLWIGLAYEMLII